MENNKKSTEKTPSKRILGIHNKLTLGDAQKFCTPPTRIRVIKNPFDHRLNELLHTNIMSPTVFNTPKESTTTSTFKWSIDDLATFKPVDIENSPMSQLESPGKIVDSATQARINRFFSSGSILPSPDCIIKQKSLLKTPNNSSSLKSNNSSQTDLSLPPILPKSLQDALKPYLTPHDKLLRNDLYPSGGDVDASTSPELYELSPVQDINHLLTPLRCKEMAPMWRLEEVDDREQLGGGQQLGRDRDGFQQQGREWNLSPISGDCGEVRQGLGKVTRRSVTKLDFSGHMSVDVSQSSGGFVPDELDGISFHNSSGVLENTPKKLKLTPPSHNTSTTPSNSLTSLSHMEDQCCTFHNNTDMMDVSCSNTPRGAKVLPSGGGGQQPRKLSDSFLSSEDEEEGEISEESTREDREEKLKRMDKVEKGEEERSDLTDIGYNTCSLTTLDELSSSNVHMYASTPTKRVLSGAK